MAFSPMTLNFKLSEQFRPGSISGSITWLCRLHLEALQSRSSARMMTEIYLTCNEIHIVNFDKL